MKATQVQNTIIKQFKIITERSKVIHFYSNGIFQEVIAEDDEVTVVKTHNSCNVFSFNFQLAEKRKFILKIIVKTNQPFWKSPKGQFDLTNDRFK